MDESVFLEKYWKFSTINTNQDPLNFIYFSVKNAYLTHRRLCSQKYARNVHSEHIFDSTQAPVPPPPKKTSSNLQESQELSGPLPKKLKSAKILKTFTHEFIQIFSPSGRALCLLTLGHISAYNMDNTILLLLLLWMSLVI